MIPLAQPIATLSVRIARATLRSCVFALACGVAAVAMAQDVDTGERDAVIARGAQALDAEWARMRGGTLQLPAPGLAPDGLRVRVYLPPGYDASFPGGYPVVYVNDGQDAEAVGLQPARDAMVLGASMSSGEDDPPSSDVDLAPVDIVPVILVAIDAPPDRMAAYGFSDRSRALPASTRHGQVGAQAHAYARWLVDTLVPTIDARFHTRRQADGRAILGWSLGGAQAFNMGWIYPEVFGRVGAFSPSLWLRDGRPDETDVVAMQRARIAQTMVAQGEYHAGSRFFFAVGDAEETDDRDGDGVIDVLDDTRDLIDGWRVAGEDAPRAKGLRQLGHSVNLTHAAKPARADVALHVLAGGRHAQASWKRMFPTFLAWAYGVRSPPLSATGTVVGWHALPSRHVALRDVDVWLPPSYERDPDRRYPVLYMHDGQNLFDPALAYTGADWDVDGAMTRLIERGEVREAIVVGVWNTPARFAEYMPRAPVVGGTVDSGIEARPIGRVEDLRSDEYLRYLVEELKPMIDAMYRTLPGRDDTMVMGSSMGGLISLYAVARYPQVFGGAGAVSTHWPACDGCTIDWFAAHLPRPGGHRLYFDHGTATLDARYAPYQARMDAALRAAGWREGGDWITRRFEGAEHNEAAWRARVEIPLRFLLAPSTTDTNASTRTNTDADAPSASPR